MLLDFRLFVFAYIDIEQKESSELEINSINQPGANSSQRKLHQLEVIAFHLTQEK